MKKLLFFVSLISFIVFGCKKQPIDTPKVEKKDSVGSLASVTFLSGPSSVSQYIACGIDGKIDGSKVVFSLRAENGPIVLTEMKFSVTPGSNITAIKVAGITAPVVANTAWITTLSVPVPDKGQPAVIEAFISYGPIGTNGYPSGTMSSISLIEVKYRMGDSRTRFHQVTGVTTPQMRSVGSRPTIFLWQSNAVLSAGMIEFARVQISADLKGDVRVDNLPLSLSLQNATISDSGMYQIRDENGTIIPTLGGVVSGESMIGFINRQIILAGQTKTYRIFANITSVGATGTASVAITLPPSVFFRWFDIAGNATVSETGTQFFPFWPVNTVVVRN